MRLNDLSMLNLDHSVEQKISILMHQDRLEWEPWIHSAVDYADLVKQLKKRGYKNTPSTDQPMFRTNQSPINQQAINQLPNQRKMLRRRRG